MSTIEGSSEVISGEDLRSRVDGVNDTTKDWIPETELKGKLTDHPGMVQSLVWSGECDLVKRDGGNQDSLEGAGEVLPIWREQER